MDSFAAVCEQVARFRARLKKVALVGAYLRPLSDPDLTRAVRFLCTDPVGAIPPDVDLFGREEKRKLAVGYAMLREACQAVTQWDSATLSLCYREVGDAGEAISLLLADHTSGQALSLEAAEGLYAELFRARNAVAKTAILKRIFTTYRPGALKYFVKIITGDLRIGLQVKMVEEAVAEALDIPLDAIRAANNALGDLAAVAVAARAGELAGIRARLFHPMDFMLAKPLEAPSELPDPENYWVEDKYDGIRSQAHVAGGEVMLYTRGMEETTAAFPDLVGPLSGIAGSAVLDGEILAWRDGRALPFSVLQQRISRKRVAASLMASVPVVFLAYDILLKDGELLLDRPFEERRTLLERTFPGGGMKVLIAPQTRAGSPEDLDRLFLEARDHGNEGLVLKRCGSVYEPGRRSGAWLKIKRPFATLDVVITAAEQGTGRRATVLSDYTFAVRSGDSFLNVGKAYSGLTDAEILELTRLLRSLTTDRFGRVLVVRPEIVLEVAFDGIQKSNRHKSGYALRFPRIVRWRTDKTVGEIDDLAEVERLYRSSVGK